MANPFAIQLAALLGGQNGMLPNMPLGPGTPPQTPVNPLLTQPSPQVPQIPMPQGPGTVSPLAGLLPTPQIANPGENLARPIPQPTPQGPDLMTQIMQRAEQERQQAVQSMAPQPLPTGPQAAPAFPAPPVGGLPQGPQGPATLTNAAPTPTPGTPPVPIPRPDAIAAAAMRAVNDPDGAAAEMAATGQEPPAATPGVTQNKSRGIGGELQKAMEGLSGSLEAVQVPDSPPAPPPVSPGGGLGGSLSPQFLQLLMGMQPQGQVGPSLGALLAQI